MSILKVARIGHPAVRARAVDVSADVILAADTQRLIDDMIETMYEYDGVGLAAPQVHVGLRLAVIEVSEEDERTEGGVPLTILVNPVVRPLSNETVEGWEGCLSIPDLRGRVPRFRRVELRALDRDGKPFRLEASDFFARVIQHECDHLDGSVYLDRMNDARSLSFIDEWDRHVGAARPDGGPSGGPNARPGAGPSGGPKDPLLNEDPRHNDD
jgi:peptide deformylase